MRASTMATRRSLLASACLLSALVNWGCSTQQADQKGVTFAGVRERVLPFGAPCLRYPFRFATGELFVLGRGPATTEKQWEQDQARIDRAGGADMEAYNGDATGFQLAGDNCLFAPGGPGMDWGNATAEQVAARMRPAAFVGEPGPGGRYDPTGKAFGLIELDANELPTTCLFKTSRGEVGIMEILGIVPDKRGVSGGGVGYAMKFRYKLVQ